MTPDIEMIAETVLPSSGADVDPDLLPVEPAYKNVLRARMSVVWVILWAAGAVADCGRAGQARLAIVDRPQLGSGAVGR